MNRLLARQLRRLGLDPDGADVDPAQWKALLERVSDSYDDADRSRYLLERSLRISSEEMAQLNKAVREQSEAEVARSERRFANLLTHSVIPTWQADLSAVGDALAALRESGVARLDTYLEKHPEEAERLAGLVDVVAQNSTAAGLLAGRPSQLPGPLATAGPIFTALRDAVRALLLAIWDDRDHVRADIRVGSSEETEFHGILHAGVPRTDGVADLSEVIVVVTDVTALKQAEERMEQLVQSKDDFLAAVSHEIRTPLTSVFGSALLLEERGDSLAAEETRELIRNIVRESGEVSDLVEDLLVAARADLGNINIDMRPLLVHPEVEHAAAGILDGPVEIDSSEVDGEVFADPLRFKQILRNLLANAVRYGGPKIVVQSAHIDGRLFLSVCDNGEEIAADRRDAIFELYERDTGKAKVTTSVGVGLTVSRQLARLMGGDLTYDHTGGWSRFRLELPATSEVVRSS